MVNLKTNDRNHHYPQPILHAAPSGSVKVFVLHSRQCSHVIWETLKKVEKLENANNTGKYCVVLEMFLFSPKSSPKQMTLSSEKAKLRLIKTLEW